jgi:hypothetical protein
MTGPVTGHTMTGPVTGQQTGPVTGHLTGPVMTGPVRPIKPPVMTGQTLICPV